LAIVGSLLILIILVTLRAVIQLRFTPDRLARVGAVALFLSFLAWESPIDGFLIMVVSLLFLALSLGCYCGVFLRVWSFSESRDSGSLLDTVIAVFFAVLVVAGIFEFFKSLFGWFLAMRWMLLIPAFLAIYELRQKGICKEGECLVIRPTLKEEWPTMIGYGLFFGALSLLLFHLVSRFLVDLEGEMTFQIELLALFLLSLLALKPLGRVFQNYWLSLAAVLLMVVSFIIYVTSNLHGLGWILLILFAGFGIGAVVVSVEADCKDFGSMKRLRLLYVALIIGLLITAAYPLLQIEIGLKGAFLIVPATLFIALLRTFSHR
jgi:hypothetical protein